MMDHTQGKKTFILKKKNSIRQENYNEIIHLTILAMFLPPSLPPPPKPGFLLHLSCHIILLHSTTDTRPEGTYYFVVVVAFFFFFFPFLHFQHILYFAGVTISVSISRIMLEIQMC